MPGAGLLRPQKAFIGRRKPIRMQSLFGVGAPEAILVGVVALVVFGPKGLAEAARSVGKLLRTFQPTIREVVEVSKDLQTTLKQELGLDELKAAARGQDLPTPQPLSGLRQADEELAKVVDPDIEAKRAQAAAMAWSGQQSLQGSSAPTQPAQPAAPAPATAAAAAAPQPAAPAQAPAAKDLQQMSMEELEAELARRKAAAAATSPQDSTPKA